MAECRSVRRSLHFSRSGTSACGLTTWATMLACPGTHPATRADHLSWRVTLTSNARSQSVRDGLSIIEGIGENMGNRAVKLHAEAVTMEGKAERFKRIAAPRLERVLQDLRLLEATSRREQYFYTGAQVETILTALGSAVERVRESFKVGKPVGENISL